MDIMDLVLIHIGNGGGRTFKYSPIVAHGDNAFQGANGWTTYFDKS